MLASQSGDVLTLNMGPRADDRRSVNIKDEDENFKVTHVSGTAGNETVTVAAFGAEQTFTGVGHIVGRGRRGERHHHARRRRARNLRAVGRFPRPRPRGNVR